MHLAYRPSALAGPGGRLIDALSGGRGYCHVELVFAGGDTLRASYGEPVTLQPGRDHTGWLMEEVPEVTSLDERIVRVWAEREVGSPYDTWGVARFVLPFMKQHPSAWFCSELCVAALHRIDRLIGTLDPWRVSPNDLLKLDKRPIYFTGLPPV